MNFFFWRFAFGETPEKEIRERRLLRPG